MPISMSVETHRVSQHELNDQADIPVTGTAGEIGVQRVRMVTADVAFKLTALTKRSEMFATHARRLLTHTPLKAILWANIKHDKIHFETIN